MFTFEEIETQLEEQVFLERTRETRSYLYAEVKGGRKRLLTLTG